MESMSTHLGVFRRNSTKTRWFLRHRVAGVTPAEARDLAMTSLRWWCLTVLPGARLQTRLTVTDGQMSQLENHNGRTELNRCTATEIRWNKNHA